MIKTKQKKEISNKVPLYNNIGKEDGIFELDKSIFTGLYNAALIYQTIVMFQANRRRGLASTKVRSEVSGGGKKPWRQKGTGRARAGSIRSPIWRGGGITFGPHPRSFKYKLPKKIRRRALLDSLNSKLAECRFGILKEISMDEPKTRKLKEVIDRTKLKGSILLAVDSLDKNLYLASRNLRDLTLRDYSNLNAFDILKHNNFLITEKAIGGLTNKLKESS